MHICVDKAIINGPEIKCTHVRTIAARSHCIRKYIRGALPSNKTVPTYIEVARTVHKCSTCKYSSHSTAHHCKRPAQVHTAAYSYLYTQIFHTFSVFIPFRPHYQPYLPLSRSRVTRLPLSRSSCGPSPSSLFVAPTPGQRAASSIYSGRSSVGSRYQGNERTDARLSLSASSLYSANCSPISLCACVFIYMWRWASACLSLSLYVPSTNTRARACAHPPLTSARGRVVRAAAGSLFSSVCARALTTQDRSARVL